MLVFIKACEWKRASTYTTCPLRLLLASLAGSHARLHQGLRAEASQQHLHYLFAALRLLLASLAGSHARLHQGLRAEASQQHLHYLFAALAARFASLAGSLARMLVFIKARSLRSLTVGFAPAYEYR